MSTDVANLRDAVIEAEENGKDADTAALVWADALQENGDDARAELVRVQVELARLDDYIECMNGLVGAASVTADRYRERNRELLAANEADWRRAGVCKSCGGSGRGACVNCIHWKGRVPRSCACGGTRRGSCNPCFGTGDVGGLFQKFVFNPPVGSIFTAEPPRIRWVRGLPYAVEVPRLSDVLEQPICSGCQGTGRNPNAIGNTCFCCSDTGLLPEWVPTPWAAAVARHHPTVRAFVVGDREPADGAFGFFWSRAEGEVHSVPSEAVEMMRPVANTNSMTWVGFATRESAIDALSRAIMKLVRKSL